MNTHTLPLPLGQRTKATQPSADASPEQPNAHDPRTKFGAKTIHS